MPIGGKFLGDDHDDSNDDDDVSDNDDHVIVSYEGQASDVNPLFITSSFRFCLPEIVI